MPAHVRFASISRQQQKTPELIFCSRPRALVIHKAALPKTLRLTLIIKGLYGKALTGGAYIKERNANFNNVLMEELNTKIGSKISMKRFIRLIIRTFHWVFLPSGFIHVPSVLFSSKRFYLLLQTTPPGAAGLCWVALVFMHSSPTRFPPLFLRTAGQPFFAVFSSDSKMLAFLGTIPTNPAVEPNSSYSVIAFISVLCLFSLCVSR